MRHVVLDTFRKGAIMGEHSVARDELSPFSIEVVSDEAVFYVIKNANLIK